jgi:hypothetical protein
VKTIAQGVPDDLAEPVVTAACFFCCRRAMGEAFTRHSLRPLFNFEGDACNSLGPKRRENADAYPLGCLTFESGIASDAACWSQAARCEAINGAAKQEE